MRKVRTLGISLALILLLSGVATLHAQQLPLAGTHFTFAVIEGPDNLISSGSSEVSQLLLSIVSDKAGCGMIVSPSGFKQSFSFDASSVTEVPLDLSLMLLNDNGKTNKGLLVTTTQPVTMNLHDFATAAGDATQLLPDEALDTSYIVASWGIFNDRQEDNHTEFVVTATKDNTSVTITPTVRTLLNQPANQPITLTLNRGECYIVKADITSFPATTSLVESRVASDKPVSVITGLTCAYNPIQFQSCNEIMDELIPRSAWGTDFNVRTLSPFNDEDIVFITSDVKNYSVIVSGGVTYFTNNGHLSIPITDPAHLIASVPVQCHELTEGSSTVINGESDPSMVSILPTKYYRDTLLWSTPNFGFVDNYIIVLYPAAVESKVLLDGVPIGNLGRIALVPRTIYSSAAIGINPGRHIVTSPQPIFGVASGFGNADAYTLVAGSVAPAVSNNAKAVNARITPIDSEVACREFSVGVSTDSVLLPGDQVSGVSLIVHYDAKSLQLRAVKPSITLNGNIISVDSSTKGTVVVTINVAPESTLSLSAGALCAITFLSIDPTRAPTTVRDTVLSRSIFACLAPSTTNDSLVIAPTSKIDTLRIPLSIDAGSAILGDIDSATISIGGLSKSSGVRSFDLLLDYDHDILSYFAFDIARTQVSNWKVVRDSVNVHTDRFSFSSSTDSLTGPGALIRVFFHSKVSDSATALISVASSISNTRFCPLAITTPDASGLFLGKDLCGDPELHQAIKRTAMTLSAIVPNPAKNAFYISVLSTMDQDVTISIIDILGRTTQPDAHVHLSSGTQKISINSRDLHSGRYVVRIESQYGSQSRMLEIAK